MTELPYASETLHIALVSLPQHDIPNYIKELKSNFYERYQKDILSFSTNNGGGKDDKHLYNPLVYYIFGNYDIALLSLVNNYKFAQKQMMPIPEEGDGPFYPESNSFQIITGSCPVINEGFSATDFFIKKIANAERFICISHLKLNNKLLIGNGNKFLQPLLKLIDKKIRSNSKGNEAGLYADNYFVQQSHSWFELTLVVFSENIEDITKVLTDLRHLTLEDLEPELSEDLNKEKLLRNSIYENLIDGDSLYLETNPHLFADTHSYFGVHFDYAGLEGALENTDNLRTQIEWQVKPGHIADLRTELQKIDGGSGIFEDTTYLLTGKTDYLIQESETKFSNNIKLLQFLASNSEVFKYIRRTKTRILLEDKISENKSTAHKESHPPFKTWLKREKLSRHTTNFNELNMSLKKMKISRNVRSKINKIFYNYNNGIQDPILFTYFLDFRIFINNLCQFIKQEEKIFTKTFEDPSKWKYFSKRSVGELENIFVKIIDIFDEGYNTRMLNCHNYEDITDFDLDFNSSVQQLLTTYNTICANIGNIFYDRNAHGPVVLLYLKNTVSNYESINYDVYHLTSPEFVFFTLIKEVLNKFVYGNKASAEQKREEANEKGEKFDSKGEEIFISDIIRRLQAEVGESRLKEYFENRLIDFEYYYLDAIKFIHTCNLDFKLYEYWFWSYNFQNASMYDRIGTFNEEHFKKELIRLCFLARLFNIPYADLRCPIPEIYYLWERHFKSVCENLEPFFKSSQSMRQFKSLIISIFKYPNITPDDMAPVDEAEKADQQNQRLEMLFAHIETDKMAFNPALLPLITNGAQGITRHASYTSVHFKEMADKLQQGIPVYCEQPDVDSFFFINCFMYASLQLIYSKNGEVRLLRRDWKEGNALNTFLQPSKSPSDNLYFIDQFGGIFFANNEKSAEYFRIRNAVLQSLWHYSLLCKKQIHFRSE